MHLSEYQERSAASAVPQRGDPISFYLHGLAGEVGSLASQYKKRLRDGEAHQAFAERMAEELGDALWYLTAVATALHLDLDRVAEGNLEKIHNRWVGKATATTLDADFPENESLPRSFRVVFSASDASARISTPAGDPIGDQLTDNSRVEDGYRFHDVIHLGFVAVLGWSPTIRALMKLKRKSDPETDEAEDGARAVFTEEAIATQIFRVAKDNTFFEGVEHVDGELLAFIQDAVSGLEVGIRSAHDWESAILQAFEVWRHLQQHPSATVECNLDARALYVVP